MSSPAAKVLGPLLRYLPYQNFNKVQEEVIPALFTDDRNCLIAAPTGTGKTVLLEVAMLRLFRHVLPTGTDGPTSNGGGHSFSATQDPTSPRAEKFKTVYICPIKALANEKYEHWRTQFPSLSVVIETGDQMQQRVQQRKNTPESNASSPVTGGGGSETAAATAEDMSSVSQADILVTTPERWDSITRRWKEKEVMAIVNAVGLLLLDEVHTVQEERGAAMEAIVSRVKAIQAATTHEAAVNAAATRIVAVSGTLPNIRDMAEWLQVNPDMTFTFSAADRPVPLTIKVISYAHDSANPFAFHRFLSFKLFSLVQQFSEGKPTLVFCAARKEVTSTAAQLVEDIRAAATRRGQLSQLQPSDEVRRLSQQASDKQLRSCLLTGVGFHHAAMTIDDRLLVERMFREQYIVVVCSTTTLALGVNLPAHLVVVKGTSFFANGQCQDMSVSEVMQMCGRAGRPGLDVHGVALVLTTQRKSHLYDTLRSGTVALTCVESHLHRHMIEHVNAEVSLHTIQSFHSATEWAKTTFFWIRLRQCPRHYGLTFANKAEEDAFSAEAFVDALMERVLRVLVEEGCVSVGHTTHLSDQVAVLPTDSDSVMAAVVSDSCCSDGVQSDIREPSVVFEPTRLGRAVSRMYILFDTVCTLNAALRKRGVTTDPRQQADSAEEKATPAVMSAATAADSNAEPTESEMNGETEGRETDGAATASSLLPCEAEKLDSARNSTAKSKTGRIKDGADATVTAAAAPFTLQETLQLLCQCQELVEVRLRQGDRGPLNEVNRAVRFPLHSGRRGGREVREDWHKAYLLIQAHVGLLPITEVSLRNDATRLWSVVPRVSRFLEEYAWAQTSSFTFACCANVLARCMERRVWPDGPVLRQLPHVSDAVAKSLVRGGYRGFDSLRSVDARQLEVLCSRLPPFGQQVLSDIAGLPHVQMELRVTAAPTQKAAKADRRRSVLANKCVGEVHVFLSPFAPCGGINKADSSATSADLRGTHGEDTVKRQTGKAVLTESAMRDGCVLLVVGAPSVDNVLLKRFIPFSAASFAPVRRGGPLNDSTSETDDVGRREVASFTFPIPPSIPFLSPSTSDAKCEIEASCFVLHMVGLDVTAHVSSSATCSTATFSSENGPTPTLEQYWTTKQPGSQRSERAEMGAAEVIENDATVPTTASAQIATAARASFNALLADMTYIASTTKHTRKRRGKPHQKPQQSQPSPERKRLRREGDEAVASPNAVGSSPASPSFTKTPQTTESSGECVASASPTAAAAESTSTVTEAAGSSRFCDADSTHTPAEAETPSPPRLPCAVDDSSVENEAANAACTTDDDEGEEPQASQPLSFSPASTRMRESVVTVRLPPTASPPAARPRTHFSSGPPWTNTLPEYNDHRRFPDEEAVMHERGAAQPPSHEDYQSPRWHFDANAPSSRARHPPSYAAPISEGRFCERGGFYPIQAYPYTDDMRGGYRGDGDRFAGNVVQGCFRRESAGVPLENYGYVPRMDAPPRNGGIGPVWRPAGVPPMHGEEGRYTRTNADMLRAPPPSSYPRSYPPVPPPPTFNAWCPRAEVGRWPPGHYTQATPPTPPFPFLPSGRWPNSVAQSSYVQPHAPPARYPGPPQPRRVDVPQPYAPYQMADQTRVFSSVRPPSPNSVAFSTEPSASLPPQPTLPLPRDVNRALSQHPTASLTAGSGSFTPHVRRSAMVSQSWWQ